TPALLAEAILDGDLEIREEQLVGVDGLAAHLLDLMHRDLVAVEIAVEQAEPVGWAAHLLQRRGARQQQDFFGDLRGRNPDLLAVDDIAVALAHRARFQLRGVQPGVWLRHRKAGALLTFDNTGQHAPALLLGPKYDHRIESKHVHVDRRRPGHAGAGLRDGAHHDRSFDDAEAGAAVFLGNTDAQPAGFRQSLVEVGGETALLVLFEPIGVVEARADFRDVVADRFLTGGERKIHRANPVL